MGIDTIADADHPWSAEKIRILVDGEVLHIAEDSAGRQHEAVSEGDTAYEQRMRCYDGDDPANIIEAAQLDRSIRRINDRAVRAAMQMRTLLGEDEYTIERYVNDERKRPGHRLVERGCELVRRIERGDHQLKTRVRVASGQGEAPVCWRCLKVEVTRIGMDCGEDCPGLKIPGKTGKRRKLEELTLEELVATQEEGTVPGDNYRATKEFPTNRVLPVKRQTKRRPAGANPNIDDHVGDFNKADMY